VPKKTSPIRDRSHSTQSTEAENVAASSADVVKIVHAMKRLKKLPSTPLHPTLLALQRAVEQRILQLINHNLKVAESRQKQSSSSSSRISLFCGELGRSSQLSSRRGATKHATCQTTTSPAMQRAVHAATENTKNQLGSTLQMGWFQLCIRVSSEKMSATCRNPICESDGSEIDIASIKTGVMS
jgi:hypothetical protein